MSSGCSASSTTWWRTPTSGCAAWSGRTRRVPADDFAVDVVLRVERRPVALRRAGPLVEVHLAARAGLLARTPRVGPDAGEHGDRPGRQADRRRRRAGWHEERRAQEGARRA